ncbi:uncharacterized protein LOC125668467 isoform X2 [Ostrea edulis]|uniref:uncharacterized protein LOC125668467 isoform X2 n=1 Tax=Ostrea edulis TaxID=37623 RepID=UPI0024AEC94D|nr:uncharacterized protein LOC125668467 isoform X2 [Ostrea edulis]
MINMNTQKRVSFGSNGSMVETWIIEDFSEHQTDPKDYFFKNLVNTANIKEPLEKSQESVRLCDLDDIVGDVPIKPLSQPSHDKARNKADSKVTFCDTPNEITSTPPALPSAPSPTGTSEIVVLSDTPLGIWPVKRSASLESRDNPFKPDGELSKEAEDILKRATIIRDTFILNDNKGKDTSRSSGDNSNGGQTLQPVQEESISQTKVKDSQSSPVSIQPKQNGVEDKVVSPDSARVEVEPNAVNDFNFKDKKKQKKCCSVM